jgi:hypothetical protein
VTKLKGLKTNRLGNINSIRNRQVASSTLALASSFFLAKFVGVSWLVSGILFAVGRPQARERSRV